MKGKLTKFLLTLSSIYLLISCPRPAQEVAIDFQGRQASLERVTLLVEAQLAREELIRHARSTQERSEQESIAKQAERQVLAQLSKEEIRMYHEQILKRRLELDNLISLLNPASIAFFQDLPTIRGVTVDLPSHSFTVELILAFDANDRRISTDISNSRIAIVDRLRNLLMQYPINAFMQGREELLREPMRQTINQTLASIGSQGTVSHIFITRFEVHPIPS